MNIIEIILVLTFSKQFSPKTVYQLVKSKSHEELCLLAASCTPLAKSMAAQEIDEAASCGASIVPCTSQDFPQQLHLLSDCPPCIYLKGALPKNEKRIAIIGTRSASDWGKECARLFAKQLAQAGVWVISGLARGIDTAAHKACTKTTLAVIGSGFAHLYPKENSQLADEIVRSGGGVISEFSCKTAPSKSTFPKRNRLISILSDALLLVEAPIKSGAMITMNLGKKQGKTLFCLPGRAMHPTYEGNHLLIKTNSARLVDTPDELLVFFEKQQAAPKKDKQDLFFTDEQKKVLDLLSQSEVSLDALSCLAGLSISRLQAILIQLQIKNFIAELPGKRYMVKR
jgi:DNA processing protein